MGDASVLDGYIRVSRVGGREGDSYISPAVQREAIQRWADYKGITIAAWHQDEDWSGGSQNRPGLHAAIARALNGETGGIVSWKIDRFSRTTEGGLRDLRRLEAANARLAFVVEDIDTGTVYGRMVYTILLAVSEAFLENIKAGWQTTKSRAVQRGAYISRTPFGYQRAGDGTLQPDPRTAAVVTEAFRIAAAHSLQAAMQHLQAHAPTRSWNATKTRRLLSGRSYLGETRYGSLAQPDTHPPLVSRAIWEAAQTTPVERRSPERFPLSGVLACETCGTAMVGSRGGKGQRTYRCANRACTHRPVITAAAIEEHLAGVCRELLSGMTAVVTNPDTDRLAILERGMLDAEAELEAFAADLTLRRALGDRYHQHLQSRVEAVEKARDGYREAAREAQPRLELSVLDVDDERMLPALLRSIFDSILVRPGRGSVAERVRLVPHDLDGSAGIVGSEDA